MKSVMRERYRERIELCKDLLKIINEGREKSLSEREILSRLETTMQVIKTVCECKINLLKGLDK